MFRTYTRKFIKTLFFIAIPTMILIGIAGCALNNSAATASMRNSDNRLAAEQSRNDASMERTRIAEDGKTDRTYISETGRTDRMYATNQMYIMMREQGTDRLVIVLLFLGAGTLIFLAVVALWYLRENPRPQPWTQIETRYIQPMPMHIARHPRTLAAGWYIDYYRGEAIRNRDGVIEISKLIEDKSR